MTFWAVFLWILQYLFQIPQNPTIFYTFFHKIAPFLHVYYTKFDKKFSFFENFGFSQKFPVGIGFFQSIKVVNIIFECWKVENVQSNKVDITSYSWTVWKGHLPCWICCLVAHAETTDSFHKQRKNKVMEDFILRFFNDII